MHLLDSAQRKKPRSIWGNLAKKDVETFCGDVDVKDTGKLEEWLHEGMVLVSGSEKKKE